MYTTTLSLGLIILSHGPAPRRGLDGAIPRFESVRSEIVAPDADDRGSSLSGLPAWWQHVRNSISLGFRDVSQALHKARGAGWNTFRTGRVQADSRGSIHPANERIDREYPLAAAGTLVGSDEDFPAGDKLDPLWRIGHAALLAASDYGDGDYYPEILGPTMNEAIGHAWIGSRGDDPPIEALDFTMLSRSAVARGNTELEIPPENADPAWFKGADPPDDRSAEDAAAVPNSKGKVAGDEVTEDEVTGDEVADPRKDAPPPAPPDPETLQGEDQPASTDDKEPESRDSPVAPEPESDGGNTPSDFAGRPSGASGFEDFESPSFIPPPIDRTPAPVAPVHTKDAHDPRAPVPVKPVVNRPNTSNTTPSITRLTWHQRRPKLIQVTVNGSISMELDTAIDRAELADPNTAEIRIPSPNRVILIGKHVGTTQLSVKADDEERMFHVSVEPNVSVLSTLIRSVSPRSDVRINTLKGQIVLSGRVSDVESARRIEELARIYQGGDVINHLSVSGVQQTLLRVVVAEVNKDATRSLGINWALGGSSLSRDFFLGNSLNQLNPTLFSSSGLADVTRGQLTYSVTPTANGPNTNITFGFPRAELQFFLNALRANSLARTLAEPNLVAISGQTASFLAGGEVPIPVAQSGAATGAITIEYKEFGVRLAFTPTVAGEQVIRLHVMTEVSDAIPSPVQLGTNPLFSFRTRRVESTIECGNGQTFAIAGLLSEQVNAIASKIPGLGDLPVLGPMFSSVDYQKSNTELVVLVTPQLVEALDPTQVGPVPGASMTDPTDFELFGLQKLEGAPRPPDMADEAIIEEMDFGNMASKKTHRRAAHRLHGRWGMEETEPDAIGD